MSKILNSLDIKNKKYRSLIYDIMIPILIVVIGILLIVSVIDYINARNDMMENFYQLNEQTERNIDKAVQLVDTGFNMLDMSLDNRLEEGFTPFIEAYNRSDGNPDDIDIWALKNELGDDIDLYIVNRDGVVTHTTKEADIGLDFSQWPGFFEYLLMMMDGEGFYSDRMTYSTQTGDLMKYAYHPSPDNKYLLELSLSSEAFVAFFEELDPSRITDELKEFNPSIIEINFYSGGEDGILDEDMKLVELSPEKEDIFNNLYIETREERQKLRERREKEGVEVIELREPGKVMRYFFIDRFDEKYASDASRVAEVVYSTEAIDKSLRDKTIQKIIIIILAIILSVIVVVFISKLISKPINQIISDVNIIANGNLEHKAKTESKNELKILVDSINSMSNNLKESFNKIKDYSENLEEKVKERTAELNKANMDLERAFEEVTDLKIKQDGDYFLTSLLLKPLFNNGVESKNINVEFYYSQKKKFTFRNWNEELGGDICIAYSLILSENNEAKEYSVFVNGDAMGKSIQGAGGSLVLGVVFNAFVTRTKFVPGASNMSPEEWLIRCYRELQDVFISFDGTMLISVVMGIIDDNTGMMYYFNAEHPWTVLYRDEKASFIEEELLNRKIGTTVGTDKIKLRTFQFQQGDIIFAGSDGRDDLLIGEDKETGMRIINEDEHLFLESVENGKGILKDIVKDIEKNGELTDDLSLVKVSYKEKEEKSKESEIPKDFYKFKSNGIDAYNSKKPKEAIEYFEKAIRVHNDPDCYLKLINSCMRDNQYLKSLNLSEKAVKLYPADLDIIFITAFLNKKHKQYEKAIYYGKRYQIHQPDNIKNLINLVDSYRLIKNYDAAKSILKQAEKIEPENENVKKLKNLLNKSKTKI